MSLRTLVLASIIAISTSAAALADTALIMVEEKGCVWCARWNDEISHIYPKTDEGKAAVDMGKAVLSEDICYSYAGRTCGACYRACPLPGKAMTIGLLEQPTVHIEHCIGCGLCEQACIHMPQAIRIIPKLELQQRAASNKETSRGKST